MREKLIINLLLNNKIIFYYFFIHLTKSKNKYDSKRTKNL